jgi:hypothetical protein
MLGFLSSEHEEKVKQEIMNYSSANLQTVYRGLNWQRKFNLNKGPKHILNARTIEMENAI